jgi:signal transduction histidine kinase
MGDAQDTVELSTRLTELESRLRILEREYQTQRQELRDNYQEIQILTGLQDLALALASTLDPEPLLKRIVGAAMELMEAEGSSLMLLDEGPPELSFEVVDGEVSQQLVGQRIKVGEGISGWVAQTGEPALVNDVQNDPRFAGQTDLSTGFHTQSLLCVPLQFQGRMLGVLTVVNKATPGGFETRDVKWLKALAALAAAAIENARLYQRVRQERDRVVIAQEEVRRKLARDLHDGPTQLVSNIVMQVDFLKKLLLHEPGRVAKELDHLGHTGQQAIQDMRMMLFDLRPLILETQGLGAALQLFTERHQVGDKTKISLHLDDAVERYGPRIESTVFSIVQEAVNNALKHARAQNLWVRLVQRGATLVVEIEDDGVGFDMEEVLQGYASRESFGLLNMRERAELVGGQMTMVSALGQGTTVMLRVPATPVAPGEEGTTP